MRQLQLRDGAHLSYKQEGEGTPILFIHAPGIGHVNFMYQKPLMTRHELIIPDLRGHGESSPITSKITIGDLAQDMKELIMHAIRKKVILCGYSHGGSVALECMHQFPELIAGAILISSFSEVSDFYMRMRFLMAEAAVKMHGTPLLVRSTASSHLHEKKDQEEWIYHGQQTDGYTLEQLYIAGHTYNCTSRLPEMTTPTLLIYGKEDKPLHRYGNILMKGLPKAEIAYIPDVKHQVVTKAADACNKLCHDFIEAVTAKEKELQPAY